MQDIKVKLNLSKVDHELCIELYFEKDGIIYFDSLSDVLDNIESLTDLGKDSILRNIAEFIEKYEARNSLIDSLIVIKVYTNSLQKDIILSDTSFRPSLNDPETSEKTLDELANFVLILQEKINYYIKNEIDKLSKIDLIINNIIKNLSEKYDEIIEVEVDNC